MLVEPMTKAFLQLVTRLQFRRSGQHLVQFLPLFVRQVLSVLDQQPATAFEKCLRIFIRLVLNAAPGLAKGIIQVLHHMNDALSKTRRTFGSLACAASW